MSKLAEETVHAKLGRGPLQTGPDGLISHCIAHALYRQAPGDGVVWDLTVTFSPNIIRPNTCVCASVCVVDMFPILTNPFLRFNRREYVLRFLALLA